MLGMLYNDFVTMNKTQKSPSQMLVYFPLACCLSLLSGLSVGVNLRTVFPQQCKTTLEFPAPALFLMNTALTLKGPD